jgi:hypothetical protein
MFSSHFSTLYDDSFPYLLHKSLRGSILMTASIADVPAERNISGVPIHARKSILPYSMLWVISSFLID